MLKYMHSEMSKELGKVLNEERSKDETFISKFMEGFKKIKEKYIEGTPTLEVYAKIILEVVDRSAPFGNHSPPYMFA